MKIKTQTLILFGLWFFLDFVLTFVGIQFLGAEESNFRAAFFYNLGWYGWLIFPVIVLFSVFIYSLLTYSGEKIINRVCDNRGKKRIGYLVPLLGIVTFSILNLYSLIHNIGVLVNGG